MTKRVFSLLMAMILTLALVACTPDHPDTSTDTGASVSSSDTATDTSTDTNSNTSSEEDLPPEEIEHKLMAITDQKNDEIVVVDLSAEDITSDAAIVWKWNARMHGDVEYASKSNKRLDDVKLRDSEVWGGMVVGITSSSGLVALVSYPSGKCLWNVNLAGYGPHSIDILPNGLIAVACSGNGNNDKACIKLFSAKSKTDTNCVTLMLPSAHGVLWDPTEEVLWGLGSTVLNAYHVGGTREKPTLSLIDGMSYPIASGGHDLSPVYGNPDRLWITSSKVAQFSKSQEKVLYDYDGASVINQGSVKSINTYADGITVMTVADKNNGTASHNTNEVWYWSYQYNERLQRWQYRMTEIKFENRDFYKVRAFVADYQ